MDGILLIILVVVIVCIFFLVFDSTISTKERIVGNILYLGILCLVFLLLVNLGNLLGVNSTLERKDVWVMEYSEVKMIDGDPQRVETYNQHCEVTVRFSIPYAIHDPDAMVLTYGKVCGKLSQDDIKEYTALLNKYND